VTVSTEEQRIKGFFEQVEEIEDVAGTLDPDDERRARLLRAAERVLTTCEPIRVSVAAELLDLSQPTVRTWARQGVLTPTRTRSPRLQLDPRRLHEVLHLVRDLRRAGTTRGLLEAVWHRLSDLALLERDDVAESLDQMRRGQGREIDPDELTS
jgi:DNA-binding transcriptional MerR regulator